MARVQYFVILLLLMAMISHESADKSHLVINFCEQPAGNTEVTIKIELGTASSQVKIKITNHEKRYKKEIARKVLNSNGIEFETVQTLIKGVTITSDSEICIDAIVVDVIVVVGQPTHFKRNCHLQDSCIELGERIDVSNVLTCPEAIRGLLHRKKLLQISSAPDEDLQPSEVPVYSTINDLARATTEIASGILETGANLKKRIDKFRDRGTELSKLLELIRKSRVDKVLSFISTISPMFGAIGGITTIMTTYLTPNPFDEISKYLDKEFVQINQKLSGIKADIGDLKHLIEAQTGVLAMAPQLRAIRYSIRNYGSLLRALSDKPVVCGGSQLLDMPETKEFIRQYEADSVTNSLLDLYGVESGHVTEVLSLLQPYMLAYCPTEEYTRVKEFAETLLYQGIYGLESYCLYRSLVNLTTGHLNANNSEMLTRFFKFERQAVAVMDIIESKKPILHKITDFSIFKIRGRSLQLYLEDEILSKLKKNDFTLSWLANKITYKNGWPFRCILEKKW